MSNDSINPWGSEATKYFYEITPERILEAVESAGVRCSGRVMALNSMENRVYEVEIVLPQGYKPKSPSERFRVVKFYRPARWTKEQILEEHQFLFDLVEYEIPVVAPLLFEDGTSLKETAGIFFTIFPKIGGRSPDELNDDALQRVGRLLARMHGAGRAKTAKNRVTLSTDTYGLNNLAYLIDQKILPDNVADSYKKTVEEICKISSPWFKEAKFHRIHGDCHLGNLLWNDAGPFWVDFDDMVTGPAVQDLWLLVPGRDELAKEKLDLLLQGYEQMNQFDRKSLRLIEPLRALRFVHFSAWISKRWSDPAFPRSFPNFGTAKYWQDQLIDLREQLSLINSSVESYRY